MTQKQLSLYDGLGRLNSFTRLKPNWNGNGALPIDTSVVENAKNVLTELMKKKIPPPQLFPTASNSRTEVIEVCEATIPNSGEDR